MFCDQRSLMWFVYIVRTSRGHLYTGVASDVERRVHEHNHAARGSRILRGQRPVHLVWSRCVANRSQAQKLEFKIKALSREAKERFVDGDLFIEIGI